MGEEPLRKLIQSKKSELTRVVKELDFIEAARVRDELIELEELLKMMVKNTENDVTSYKKDRKTDK